MYAHIRSQASDWNCCVKRLFVCTTVHRERQRLREGHRDRYIRYLIYSSRLPNGINSVIMKNGFCKVQTPSRCSKFSCWRRFINDASFINSSWLAESAWSKEIFKCSLSSRVHQNLAILSENYRTFPKLGPHYKEKACKFLARSDYSLRPNSCILFEIFVARRKNKKPRSNMDR